MNHRMITWFHNLKVAQKLALISFIFVLPDSIMLYLFVTSINENIQFAKLEQTGNQYQRPLERLLDLLPTQRLEARGIAGNALPRQLVDREHDIDEAFSAVAKVDARLGGLSNSPPKAWLSVIGKGATSQSRAAWENLKRQTREKVLAPRI